MDKVKLVKSDYDMMSKQIETFKEKILKAELETARETLVDIQYPKLWAFTNFSYCCVDIPRFQKTPMETITALIKDIKVHEIENSPIPIIDSKICALISVLPGISLKLQENSSPEEKEIGNLIMSGKITVKDLYESEKYVHLVRETLLLQFASFYKNSFYSYELHVHNNEVLDITPIIEMDDITNGPDGESLEGKMMKLYDLIEISNEYEE